MKFILFSSFILLEGVVFGQSLEKPRVDSWSSLATTIGSDIQKTLDLYAHDSVRADVIFENIFTRLTKFEPEGAIYRSNDAGLWESMALQDDYWNVSYYGLTCLARTGQPNYGLVALRVSLAPASARNYDYQTYACKIIGNYEWRKGDVQKALSIIYASSNVEFLLRALRALPIGFKRELILSSIQYPLKSEIAQGILLESVANDDDFTRQHVEALSSLARNLERTPGIPRWSYLVTLDKLGVGMGREEQIRDITETINEPATDNALLLSRLVFSNRSFIEKNRSEIEQRLDIRHRKALGAFLDGK